MATKGVMETATRWQLRATLVVIGILTMIYCTFFLIYFTCILMEDLLGIARGNVMFQSPETQDFIFRSMTGSVGVGMQFMCDFRILTNNTREEVIAAFGYAPEARTNTSRTRRGPPPTKRMLRLTKKKPRPSEEKGPPTTEKTTPTLSKKQVKTKADKTWTPSVTPKSVKTTTKGKRRKEDSNRQEVDNSRREHKTGALGRIRAPRNRTRPTARNAKRDQSNFWVVYEPEVPSFYTGWQVMEYWTGTRMHSPAYSAFTGMVLGPSQSPSAPPEYSAEKDRNVSGKVNAERCEEEVSTERAAQMQEVMKNKGSIFGPVLDRFVYMFIVLDIILLILSMIGLIVGFLLILGAIWKSLKMILPWLLLTFPIAWGAVAYGIAHAAMTDDSFTTNVAAFVLIILAIILIIGLHIWAFVAVVRYYNYLWRRHSNPDAPVRRMRLVLTKTT